MSVNNSSEFSRGEFLSAARIIGLLPSETLSRMAQNSSFPWNPCRWPCLGDGNFSALLPGSVMVHFSPKTLKSPVSCLVTINPHFLSFQTRNHLLCSVLWILCCSSSPSARNCFPVVHCPRCGLGPVFILWCLHYTWFPVFSSAPTEHHLPFPSSSGTVSHCLCHIQSTDLNISSRSTFPNSRKLKKALITIHFGYVPPQMSPSVHQCCVDTSVFPVDIDFFSYSIWFWAQAAYTFPVRWMKFRDRHRCREFPVGAVSGTTMTGIQIKARQS